MTDWKCRSFVPFCGSRRFYSFAFLALKAWLAYLRSNDKLHLLDCDVYKVPHHGSRHVELELFDESEYPDFDPPISVASMGSKGFEVWKHPSPVVVEGLGGAHRFYSTYIKERTVNYDDFTDNDFRRMVERSNILIETDGEYFRIVELPAPRRADSIPVLDIPSIRNVEPGDGTRWISAKREDESDA